ncbi:MAG TPA: DUF3347 domain-containing protein, partial [Phycisphaerales bacterium]|nr:DUF3347 domain-containing protein [Phycisphaerales bacterium]
LGPRAGNYYIVRSGLEEGELVVTKGNFKIDSALQIQAKPSMMTPEGGGGGGGHAGMDMSGSKSKSKSKSDTGMKNSMALSAISRQQLYDIIRASKKITDTYKKQDISEIRFAFEGLQKAVKAVDMEMLEGRWHMLWAEMLMRLNNDAVEGKDVKTLQEVERIVESLKTNIVSLKAKFGLMDMTKPKTHNAVEPEFLKQLGKVFDGYFEMQKVLAEDKFDKGITAADQIKKAIAGIDMKLLSDENQQRWMKQSAALKIILSDASSAENIESLRQVFAMLSGQMFVLGRQFGPPGESTLYQLKCPMAFDGQGATWLQQDKDTHNPYLGSVMLQCGDVVDVIRPADDKNIGGRQHD